MFVATCRGCNESFDGQTAWQEHEASCPALHHGVDHGRRARVAIRRNAARTAPT